MLTKLRKQTQGFTIIEVLIVLAIAALILLIVFLAVPALQRNNRNTQIRNDANVLLGFINDFAANNNGALPGATGGICYASTGEVGMITGNTGCSTTTNNVGKLRGGLAVTQGTAQPGGTNALVIDIGHKCSATNTINGTASARAVAVGFRTETAGGTNNQCVES